MNKKRLTYQKIIQCKINNKIQKLSTMQGQIQQMKSSIANIQQHLRRLQCEQTLKTNQIELNILPESIIKEHINVYEKPSPTPKITQSFPNITRTEVFTPARHHLDDTQMRKALRDDYCTTQKESKGAQRSVQKPKKKNRRKQKSLTVKTKYIYDGGRVVYVPPQVEAKPDYGYFVVKTQRKRSRSPSSSSEKQQQSYNKPDQQYGIGHIRKVQNEVNSKKQRHKLKRRKQRFEDKQQGELQKYLKKSGDLSKKKIKMSQFTTMPYELRKSVESQQNNTYVTVNKKKKDKKSDIQPIDQLNLVSDKKTQRIRQKSKQIQILRQQKLKQKQRNSRRLKSMKIQCNINQKKKRVKPPFIIDWDPNTDSEFSGLEI